MYYVVVVGDRVKFKQKDFSVLHTGGITQWNSSFRIQSLHKVTTLDFVDSEAREQQVRSLGHYITEEENGEIFLTEFH